MLDAPDNVAVSPSGGIVLCEDGDDDQFVRGLTQRGQTFDFVKNIKNDREFAGGDVQPRRRDHVRQHPGRHARTESARG
jgi:secreted PhoX family phosphatase